MRRVSIHAIAPFVLFAASSLLQAAQLCVPSEFATIAEAVEAAASGDTIRVAAGTYTGQLNRNIDPGGRDLVFLAPEGSATTIIDCQTRGRAFSFVSGETSATVVRGFTIRNGDGYATPTLKAGAVRCFGSSPSFFDCVFQDCVGEFGGAIMAHNASPTFDRCQFVGNSACAGGAICMWDAADASVNRCLFLENIGEGAAIEAELSSVKISWCDFLRNDGSNYSCGIMVWGSPSPTIANCTFYANINEDVLYFSGGATPVVQNVIVAFNRAKAMRCLDSIPVVQCSESYGNTGGNSLCANAANTLHSDPMLCDPANNDVTLCADSPCLPANNPWGVLIGAHDAGCGSCATAVEGRTWGAIKALYR